MLAASAALTATPGFAVPRYDGLWSVSIVTKKGDCVASYRYPMRIANGLLGNGGNLVLTVSGKVAASGAVIVKVSSGDHQRHRLRPARRQCRERLLARRFLLGLVDGGAAEFVGQSFRASRGACHRAGHFGPNPLARLRNDNAHPSAASSSPVLSPSSPARIFSAMRPAFCRIAASIFPAISGLALRKVLAFSRPWPMRWLS